MSMTSIWPASGWTFTSFNSFLAVLQDEVWSKDLRDMTAGYLDQLERTRQFLAAVDDGYNPPVRCISEIIGLGFMAAVGWEHFRDKPGFDDDGFFTSGRFAMVFAYQRQHPPYDDALFMAAHAQLGRMLAAGRVSPDEAYLSDYMSRANGTQTMAVHAQLVAHFPGYQALMERRVAAGLKGNQGTNSNGDEFYAMMQYGGEQALVAGEKMRESIFRNLWLPNAIGSEEYARVAGRPVALLRDLYAGVWAEGYAGYHERLVASGVMVAPDATTYSTGS